MVTQPLTTHHLLLNLNNPFDMDEAVIRLTVKHQVIAVNFQTFGLLGSATTATETFQISLPKGIHTPKPHTLVLRNIDDIIPAIDKRRLHPLLANITGEPQEFYQRVAHLTHVRIPVITNASINGVKLHPGVLSFEDNNPHLPLAQFIMFTAKPQEFITKAYERGLKLGAVTSMNYTAEPTITSVRKALEFLERSKVDTLVYQPNTHIQPSYPGIALTKSGIILVRKGHIPTETITQLWHDVPFQVANN